MEVAPPILAIAALYAFLKWGAKNEANIDDTDIGNGVKIDHLQRWLDRAGVALVAALMIWTVGLFHYGLDPLWAKFMALVLLGGAFWFSFWFRKYLNQYRGDWWWYMGTMLGRRKKGASKYDQAFHFAAWVITGCKLHEGYPEYPERLPAYIARITELSFATLSIARALWIIYTPTP